MLHEHMARKAKCTEWVEFSCKLVHTTCSCFLCAAMGRTLRSCFLVLLFLSCRFELRSMCFAMSSHDRAKAEKPFIEANCFPPTRHMRQVKASGREIPILFKSASAEVTIRSTSVGRIPPIPWAPVGLRIGQT